MSEQVTIKTLRRTMERITKNHGIKWEIEWAYGRPRVTNIGQSVNISPRLTKRELALWLDGYEVALDTAKWSSIQPITIAHKATA